jgi:hypothetical protein
MSMACESGGGSVAGFLRGVIILVYLREGVYLYTMTPSRIANKLRGDCSYHTPIRVVLSTKKLGNILVKDF